MFRITNGYFREIAMDESGIMDMKGIPQEIIEKLSDDDKDEVMSSWMDYVDARIGNRRHSISDDVLKAAEENLDEIVTRILGIDTMDFIEANKSWFGGRC